jgi:hypothetical protein
MLSDALQPAYVAYSVALRKLHMPLMTGRTLPRSSSVQVPLPPIEGGKAQGSMAWVVLGCLS